MAKIYEYSENCSSRIASESVEFNPSYGLDFSSTELSDTFEKNTGFDERIDSMTKEELQLYRDELAEIRDIERFRQWIDGVNPKYDQDAFDEFSTNCGMCTLATWMRAKGHNPEALTTTGDNIGSLQLMEDITGLRFEERSASEVLKCSKTVGSNWNGMLAMIWPSGESGHWVNVATNENGRMYVLDSQCGEIMPFADYARENPAKTYFISEEGGAENNEAV